MNLVVNIESTDRTNYVIWKSFIKTDNINSRIDTCTFSTRKYGSSKSWKPSVGDEVEVLDGATKVFAGVIVNVKESLEGAKMQKFDVMCKDWTHYLDKRLVVERYENQTVAQIIQSLVSTYTSDGFTTTNVVCNITIDSIAFNYIAVSEAIQMLAEQVNFSWYVDYSKDIHFFDKNIEPSPFDLTDTNGKYIFKSLIVEDDLSQLRNRIIVRGGEKEYSQRSETIVSDGKQTTFPLGYKYSSKPTVTVNGGVITVGVDFLDDDASYTAMWNYNERYIRLTGSPYNSGTPVTITGTPLMPIIVQAEDDVSIVAYGAYEFRKIDKSISTSEEARQYAVAQLDAYKASVKEGNFQTYESGLRSGQLINVQSTIRSIDEDFIIQSVNLRMRSPTEGIYTVILATLRTIGIIEFLQKLLLEETKKIEIGESEVLEKFYIDHQNLTITESITVHTEVQDHQNLSLAESIRKDPWTPIWVLCYHTIVDDDDAKRDGRLSISMYLY